ncbi:MarR family winged helix-turn-helix transcriptional regulator [Falsirhodobacter sp. 20TX0035]|uniref:MarR family winged helix-turn-helix transcriptional regulator n=1 Tax=Falsirhodobacter sp. 20TX0035 TaxID=3022019 RepID=UPI00232F6C8F|nr:MarR family transcriptional regulator [Falsirhodobacter sp. 20TX0035]MDB6454136.1 MarR family transcriptional regulator [Falsirhodobacter sp. 20TX0035]
MTQERDHPDNVDGLLEGTLSWYIRSLDSLVSRDLDRRMARLPVARGKGKITALLLVDDHPGIRPSAIATVLMRDRPTTGRIVERLVEAGLIRRQVAGDDQRAQSLTVTEQGRTVAAQVRAIIREQERDFFAHIPADERRQFHRILKQSYHVLRAGLT